MKEPAIFTMRPLAVQALRWTGSNTEAVDDFTADQARFTPAPDGPPQLTLATPQGDMTTAVGDWIVKGLAGEFYPVPEDVFHSSYAPHGGPE